MYTAEVYVENNGKVMGPYSGSTYPNAPDSQNTHKTVNEGDHRFNNRYGHSGGSQKGLNLVDENNERRTPAKTTPGGQEATAVYVNVHSGQPLNAAGLNNRGSEACLTIDPADAAAFFSNFDWTGSYNGYSGNSGNSSGSVTIFRGESREANAVKDQLQFAQRLWSINTDPPLVKSDATRVSTPIRYLLTR